MKNTVSVWKKKLDIVFSKYIHIRDKVNGKGQCFTCGSVFPIDELDAGHFRSRKYNATRYDEINVQLQCRKCNRFDSGALYEFGTELDTKYGKGTALNLIHKSYEIKKFSVDELKSLYVYYKGKLNTPETHTIKNKGDIMVNKENYMG